VITAGFCRFLFARMIYKNLAHEVRSNTGMPAEYRRSFILLPLLHLFLECRDVFVRNILS